MQFPIPVPEGGSAGLGTLEVVAAVTSYLPHCHSRYLLQGSHWPFPEQKSCDPRAQCFCAFGAGCDFWKSFFR